MNYFYPLLKFTFQVLLCYAFFGFAPELKANDPCTAWCYDFSCNANNCSVSTSCASGVDWVPCGNGANTSPGLDVHTAGTTSFALQFPGSPCGSGLQPAPNNYVAWITLVVQGSSFEWQIVETGGDDVYYEFYYSNLPEDDPNACSDLTYYSCGDDFNSWELQGSPHPTRPVRMYIALYATNPDSDISVNLKFRKACGEACINSDVAVTASPDQCLVTGSSVMLNASASGGGGGPYQYLWSPNDGSINDITLPNPTITPAASTVYYVQAIGVDGCPAFDSVRVQVGGCCLEDPVIRCPADYDGCPGDSVDPSNTGTATATYGSTCWPPIITHSDQIVSTGPCSGETVIKRTWRAQDPDSPTRFAECIQIITLEADGPSISCPADQTVDCFSDIYVNPGLVQVTTDCSLGYQVGVSGPQISGTANCPNTTYTYTYTVTDDCGRTASCDQVFTIDNGTLSVSCPAASTVNCSDDIVVNQSDVSVTSGCNRGYSVVITGPVIAGAADCPNTTYTYTYTVTDDCNQTASCNRIFTINNSGPSVSCPADVTVACPADIVVNQSDVTVNSSCGLGYSVVINGPYITGSGNCSNQIYKYTYVVTDDCGSSASCNRFFHIDNDVPPTPPTPPANITLECEEPIPPAPALVAMDDCGGNITASPTEQTFPGSCAQEYTLKRTWTFVDACGNSVSVSQSIFVEDNTAPVFLAVPADEDVCGSPPPFGTPTVQDNCSIVSLSESDQTIWGDCQTGEQKIRTWTATDECGNTATASQSIIFYHDDTPPEFWDCPGDITVDAYPDCDAVVHWYPPTATDNCGIQSVTSNYDPYDTFAAGMTTVTYTAIDNCGNEATCTFKVTVLAPELRIECPDDIYADCDYGYSGARVYWDYPTVTSSCGNSCVGNPAYIQGFVYMGELNGHHYYCSTFPATWTYAQSFSESAGGSLAVINSAQENQFLTNLVQASAAYIGLSDRNNEGVFEWVNGDPVTYTNWYPGQPNNYNGAQDYVELLNNGQWNDQYTSEKREFIMELPCQYVQQISGPPRGSLIGPGTTQICYAAYDGNGNSDTCCFNIIVDGLTITCPDDITVNCAYGQNGADVSWDAPELSYCGTACYGGDYIPGFIYMGELNDHHYYCSDYTANWAYAKSAAEFHGGHLAVINSQQENDYLASRLQAGTAWIGLTDEAYEGNFQWVNGDAYSYYNWYPGQPNNYNGAQDHVEMLYNGQWNDENGYGYKEFIMEMPCTRIVQIAGPPSGSWLDPGTETITYVGYDGAGNTDTCSFTVTVNCTNDPDYCPSWANNSYYTWINRIQLEEIDNVSGNNGGYADFSYMSASLEPGKPYVLGLTPGSWATYMLYWKIWIDYNQDGDFGDTGELLGYVAGTSSIYGQFTVPYFAVHGETRMRIQMAYGGYPYSPCDYFTYGEVEDYTIYIKNPYFNDPSAGEQADDRNMEIAVEDLEAISQSPTAPAPDWDNAWTILDNYKPTASPDLTIQEDIAVDDFRLFPNPAYDYIEVDLRAYEGRSAQLVITNKLGQRVYSEAIGDLAEGFVKVDVSALASGVYLLSVHLEEDTIRTKPFVVQR